MIKITQEEIMQDWGIDNSEVPLVSVKCMTFNHEKYISQAIDGFLMQKTTFPFEVLIHDDASTDKTADIIREYEKKFPQIVKGIYETENQFSKGNRLHHIKINAAIRGKYLAFCEGDDYWIDEKKLQKQVSFLEDNPDYSMCYGKVQQYYETEKNFSKVLFGASVSDYKALIYGRNSVPTLSVCLHRALYQKFISLELGKDQNWLMGDYPLWIYLAHDTKIKFMDEVFGVYRILKNSASHSVDITKRIQFQKSKNDISNYFCDLYHLPRIPWDENKAVFDILYLDLMENGYIKEITCQTKNVYKDIKNKSRRERIIRLAISCKSIFLLYRKIYYFFRNVRA